MNGRQMEKEKESEAGKSAGQNTEQNTGRNVGQNKDQISGQTSRVKRRHVTVPVVFCLLLVAVLSLIRADARSPLFYVVGGLELETAAGEAFEDPGVYAVLSGRIFGEGKRHLPLRTEGRVDTAVPGIYELAYTVEYRGKEYRCVRTVRVAEADPLPEPVAPAEKTIYLTFDDGPGPETGRLLDILAKYDAKATFFVTCDQPEYFSCIARAYREGHAVGIHTASHVYREIYRSEEAFFSDFYQVQNLIVEQTGEETRLYRFPGGSDNTVSSFNPGIMTRLAAELHGMGYQYFDWDIKSGDAGETESADGVFRNVTEGMAGRETAIVLQHDIKSFSVDAVERIILWGLENGFVFRALDLNSPPAHFQIAN